MCTTRHLLPSTLFHMSWLKILIDVRVFPEESTRRLSCIPKCQCMIHTDEKFLGDVPRRTIPGSRFRPNQAPSRLSESQFGREYGNQDEGRHVQIP